MENPIIEKRILIDAGSDRIWETLTLPKLMLQWMGDPEMQLQVITEWETGQSLIIKGIHHLPFENRGRVLAVEPGRRLQYSQISSLSRLEEEDRNYSVFEFILKPEGVQTWLLLTITGFPTTTIYQHLAFYWNGTLYKIKQVAESRE